MRQTLLSQPSLAIARNEILLNQQQKQNGTYCLLLLGNVVR